MISADLPRVLFISHSVGLGGAERALTNLLKYAPREKLSIIVAFPEGDGPSKKLCSETLQLPVVSLPFSAVIPLRGHGNNETTVNRLASLFESTFLELELDAIVINTTTLIPAAIAAVRAGIPFLLHSHGILNARMLPELDEQQWLSWEHLQIQLAHEVICPSSWIADHYRRAYQLQNLQVDRLPNGTSIPERVERAANASAKKFVMLCTLEPNKGVMNFLKAITLLSEEEKKGAAFEIFGDGLPEYREQLEHFIASEGLADYVLLRSKQADVANIYASAYAVVVASEIESFSFVVIEAMSYGRPVIATRCGGPDEIITSGIDGILVPVNVPSLMAEQIKKLLVDSELGSALGNAARDKVTQHYDIVRIAERYFEKVVRLTVTSQDEYGRQSFRQALALQRDLSILVVRNEGVPESIAAPAPPAGSAISSDLLNRLKTIHQNLRNASIVIEKHSTPRNRHAE